MRTRNKKTLFEKNLEKMQSEYFRVFAGAYMLTRIY